MYGKLGEIIIKSHNQKVFSGSNQTQNQCTCAGGRKYGLKGGNYRSENIFTRQQ